MASVSVLTKKEIKSISNDVFNQIGFMINAGRLLGGTPFSWLKKDYTLKSIKNKRKFHAIYIHMTMWFVLGIFYSIQFVRFAKNSDISLSYIMSFFMAILSWSLFFTYAMWISFSTQVAAIISDMLNILYNFEARYLCTNQMSPARYLKEMLLLTKVAPSVFGILIATSYIFLHKDPMNIYGHLPKGFQNLIFALLVAFVSFWMVMTACCLNLSGLQLLLIFYQVFATLGRELKLGNQMYATNNSIRRSPNIILKYANIMKVYLEHLQDIIGFVLIPIQSMMTRVIIVVITITIRYYKTLHPIMLAVTFLGAFFLFILWCTALVVFNHISDKYNELLKSLCLYTSQNTAHVKFVKLCRISRKPVHFRIGFDNPITVQSVPLFIIGLSRGTMKVLAMSLGEMSAIFNFDFL